MGGGHSKHDELIEKKKVVIIGFSFGGRNLLKSLLHIDPDGKRFEILILDKESHFEFICTNYFGLTEPEAFMKNAVDFQTVMKTVNKNFVQFKQSQLVNIDHTRNEITAQNFNGQEETISYDILALSTGSTYNVPWRGQEGKSTPIQERDMQVKKIRDDLAKANSILIVGCGPTGLESAGWLKDKYPSKKIAVCQRGKVLFPNYPGAHDVALRALQRQGVEVRLGQGYAEDQPIAKEFEQVLDCRGFKFTGPGLYMQGDLKVCLDKKTGQILVNSFGQVTQNHPFVEQANKPGNLTLKNVFALGDACLTPMNEVKAISSIYQYVDIIAHNIEKVCKNHTDYKAMPRSIHRLSLVPIGKNYGFFLFNKMAIEKNDAHTMKLEMEENFVGFQRGQQPFYDRYIAASKQNQTVFGLASGCCVCLPMHISKSTQDTEKELQNTKAEHAKFY